MITPLTAETLQGAKLTPAATAAVSPDWFKQFGVTFVRDEDDLDSYEFAGISIKGLACGLLRYTHSPAAETTLLGPQGVATDRLIRAFAGAFDLPLDCFHWRPLDQTEA
jgi:hypothetical protein